jgi:hypothetical protein
MLEYPLCNIWRTTVSWSAIAQMPPGFRQAAHRRSGKAKGLASASGPPEPVAPTRIDLTGTAPLHDSDFRDFPLRGPSRGICGDIRGRGQRGGRSPRGNSNRPMRHKANRRCDLLFLHGEGPDPGEAVGSGPTPSPAVWESTGQGTHFKQDAYQRPSIAPRPWVRWRKGQPRTARPPHAPAGFLRAVPAGGRRRVPWRPLPGHPPAGDDFGPMSQHHRAAFRDLRARRPGWSDRGEASQSNSAAARR